MKALVLTGLANETDFNDGEVVQYLLVFNKGELRVPVDEDSARLVLHYMFGEQAEQEDSEDEHAPPVPPAARKEPESEVTEDDDGVDQV
jgi:hypothetical protein